MWTLIVLGAGDNDLEAHIAADIEEMGRRYGSGTKNVNIVAQLDRRSTTGTYRYVIHGEDGDRVRFDGYELQEDGSSVELNTGDPETLVELAGWAARCYPADRYILIVEGHGMPWSERRKAYASAAHERASTDLRESVRLLAYDETTEKNGVERPEMSVAELQDALVRIKTIFREEAEERTGQRDPDWLNRLVIYGSDACLMQTVEVAYALRNTATYVIGSADTEPDSGWPYNTIIYELTNNGPRRAGDPSVLAEHIVLRYQDSYSRARNDSSRQTTLSAIRPIEMNRVTNSLEKLGMELLARMDSDPRTGPLLWEARRRAYTFGDSYADLPLFLSEAQRLLTEDGIIAPLREATDNLREAFRELMDERRRPEYGRLHELVLYGEPGRAYPGAWGLSIYLPWDECASGLDLEDYARAQFAQETKWNRVIEKMLSQPGRADLERGQYYGTGKATAVTGAERLADVSIYCDVLKGRLDIYAQDESIELSVSARLSPVASEAQITKARARIGSSEAAFQGLVATPLHFERGLPVSGDLVLAVDTPSGPAELDLSFTCEEFEREGCGD